jgi:hypothetical protein
VITVGNFDCVPITNKKGIVDWIFKSKAIPKKPIKVVEPTEYKLLTEIENSMKEDYSKTLINTVSEIIIFIKDV